MMIALEAHAPALNRFRSWTPTGDQDLFGRWQAVVTFGRIGRHGQASRHAFEDEAGLSRFVRSAILRRKSATPRIGVSVPAAMPVSRLRSSTRDRQDHRSRRTARL
jgi:predicted DNA-binding WGR domain protein